MTETHVTLVKGGARLVRDVITVTWAGSGFVISTKTSIRCLCCDVTEVVVKGSLRVEGRGGKDSQINKSTTEWNISVMK